MITKYTNMSMCCDKTMVSNIAHTHASHTLIAQSADAKKDSKITYHQQPQEDKHCSYAIHG